MDGSDKRVFDGNAALAGSAPGAGDEHEPRIGITGRWRIWQEQRHARAAAQAAVRDFEQFRQSESQLKGEELYIAWVARHGNLSQPQALQIVNKAEASFASWPENCDLRFVHVVQYVIISEYLAAHPERKGTAADMSKVIAAVVPLRY